MDSERIHRIQQALQRAQLDAFICSLPARVLMTTGYWPVVGTSVAIVVRDGRTLLLAPHDEQALADRGWAEVRAYHPATLERLSTVAEQLARPLGAALHSLGLEDAKLGVEHGPASEPASYAAMYLFGAALPDLVDHVAPRAALSAADEHLEMLAAVKTPAEVEHIRLACSIAADAFLQGSRALGVGMPETEVAARFREPLSVLNCGPERPAHQAPGGSAIARADGFVFCMSGPNAAEAGAAYARSRGRPLQAGDLVLVHCNSYADGWWTDITRTYALGHQQKPAERMWSAVSAARDAALAAIRPGARCCEVDRAAREQITRRGFGGYFTHSTGHGIGFAAISANARPASIRSPRMSWNRAWYSTWSRPSTLPASAASGIAMSSPWATTAAKCSRPFRPPWRTCFCRPNRPPIRKLPDYATRCCRAPGPNRIVAVRRRVAVRSRHST